MAQYSLVICTRNRARSLEACLSYAAAAGARMRADWEVIVVDNGSTDDTPAVAAAFAARRLPFRIRYCLERQAGVSRAKNRGIAASTGAAVMFTDDDCYLEADYFAAVETLLSDDRLDYFGGRIVLHDPTDDPVTTKDSDVAAPIAPGSVVEAGTLHGANMGFRRRVIERIGGFNIALGPGAAIVAGEDAEYLARASAAGFAGGYFPGPVVRHHHRRKPPDVLPLYRGYACGRGAFYASMIIDSRSRWLYLRHWLSRWWSWRRPPLRQLQGAFHYAMRRIAAGVTGRSLIPRDPGAP